MSDSSNYKPFLKEDKFRKNRKTSRFARIFSYLVLMIVIILGVFVLAGVFKMAFPSLQIPLGVIIIGYSVVRLFMQIMKYREEDREEIQQSQKNN